MLFAWINRFTDVTRKLLDKLGPFGKYGLIVFLSTRLSDVLMLLYKFSLGRVLQTYDFGAVEPISRVIGVMAIPLVVLTQTGVKIISRLGASGEIAKRNGFVRDCSSVVVAGAIWVFAATLVFQDLILSRLHVDSSLIIWLIAGTAVSEILVGWVIGILQGEQRFKLIAVIGPLNPLALIVFAFVLVSWASLGLEGALLAKAVPTFSFIILILILIRGHFTGPRASYSSEIKMIWTSYIPLTVFIVGTKLLMDFDPLFVRNFWPRDSGGYGAIITLGQIPMWAVSSLVVVLFPMASADHSKGKDVRLLLKQSMLFGFFITAVSAVFFAVFGEYVLRLWNAPFAPYARYLWPFSIAMGLHGLILAISSYEIARHRYGSIYWLLVPAVIYCVTVYLLRGTIKMDGLICMMIGVRVVVLGGMYWRLWLSEKALRPAA